MVLGDRDDVLVICKEVVKYNLHYPILRVEGNILPTVLLTSYSSVCICKGRVLGSETINNHLGRRAELLYTLEDMYINHFSKMN